MYEPNKSVQKAQKLFVGGFLRMEKIYIIV